VLERYLADSLRPGEIDRIFRPYFDQAVALLRSVDSASRSERYAAVESLMAFTGRDSPELRDVVVAAVRRGTRAARAELQTKGVEPSSIERQAVLGILEFEDLLTAVGIE